MSITVFVEQLNAAGDVIHRTPIHELPIKIGRAYNNHIILDDHHTAPHHAQIELNEEGQLSIRDLESLNGLSLNNKRKKESVIDGDHIYRLGHTRLRIRRADYVVTAEMSDSTNHTWEGWKPALIGIVLTTMMGLLNTWLSDISQNNVNHYLTPILSLIGILLLWSGFWALLNKLFAGRARLGRHLFIAGLGVAVLEIWENLSGIIAFSFSWEWLATYTSHPLFYLCAVILYFHLDTINSKNPWRLKISLMSFALLCSVVTITKHYQSTDHFSDELYLNRLYPPSLRVTEDIPLDTFSLKIDELKNKVDNKRKE
jgi:FHA domain